jgi:VWFA-related protein
MRKRPGAALLLAVLMSPASVAMRAQDAPVERVFAEDLEVNEVLLDVLVTDRHDRVILGLGADDFVVSEEGEAVELTSVVFYSSRRLIETSESSVSRGLGIDRVPRDRFFILFVEEQRHNSIARPSLVDRQRDAGREVSRWLAEEAQLADRVAVVSFRYGLRVHQDFTRDRQALFEAVDGAVHGRDPSKTPPSRRREVASDPAALSSLPAGKELRKASRDIYGALRLVAGAVKSVPGRKNLIFLGRGFGDVGTYGNYQPESSKLNPTLAALNDANVAVYTVDVTPPGLDYNLQVSLRNLAAATGGRFYYNQPHFAAPLRSISELTRGYYLLSYESRRPAGTAGYQRVKVGTRSPEFRIQARDGYLYGSPPR